MCGIPLVLCAGFSLRYVRDSVSVVHSFSLCYVWWGWSALCAGFSLC